MPVPTLDIPVVAKGPVPPPVQIDDLARGKTTLWTATDAYPMLPPGCAIGVVELKKGTWRGAHVHFKAPQYFLIMSGTCELWTKANEHPDTPIEKQTLKGPCACMAPAGIPHVFVPLEDGWLVEYMATPMADFVADSTRVDFGL